MDKLKMQTANKADENFKKLAAMFPNAVTETIDENGEVVRAIDKDVLMQEISCKVVDGNEERYQFTWPDKKKSVLLANAPINKTLRPCREESVDFDNTENLYIEGDNLEVLKLLQETYLGKIKMIYIDPPYNTGNDFVYADDFAQSTDEYLENSGQFDEDGNRLVKNLDSNGRFHTDWLNMIYPRLKLAKDLLSEDGLIFISIDNNEIENLRKVCDEIFGASNCVSQLVWKNKYGAGGGTNSVAYVHEYILVYAKNEIISITCDLSDELISAYNKQDEKFASRGGYLTQPLASTSKGARANLMYPIFHEGNEIHPPKGGRWIWSKEKFDKAYANNEVVINKTKDGWSVRFKQYLKDEDGTMRKGTQLSMITNVFNQEGTKEFAELMGDKRIFDFPKPTKLISQLLKLEINGISNKDAIILDFFSGSASTANAVMQLNAEDGGHRKFIMVQLPEETDENSEAYKAGYKNICEIGKERIRRAGQKILNECGVRSVESGVDNSKFQTPLSKLDIGFRVLKCDTSNMKEVYYNPAEYEPSLFSSLEDNIKEDRTPEDLLFQVMLDLGILLSSKIECGVWRVESGAEYKYFNVEDGYLIACFDKNISEELITEIAKQKPYYFVMRDSSMANDSVATNFEQIFAAYSPDTVRKVL